MSKRSQTLEFYLRNAQSQRLDELKYAAESIANRIRFKGPSVAESVIVRCDLNGYSKWAKDSQISERVELLNDFFSTVIPLLHQAGGVYFRDEGDCVVAMFSTYFDLPWTFDGIIKFCKDVVGKKYGREQLTAKVIVTVGSIAIYQKIHEQGSDDWSAEGQPFVDGVRLEQAVDSKPKIYFLKTAYEGLFAQADSSLVTSPGQMYYWLVEEEKIQAQGFAAPGGWVDMMVYSYCPEGRRL